MTEEQITNYEYCKKHLVWIKGWKETLPFGIQKYGCGSSVPRIEHSLERIHKDMFEKVRAAMNEANEKVQGLIDNV
jgi:hypothetical protein